MKTKKKGGFLIWFSYMVKKRSREEQFFTGGEKKIKRKKIKERSPYSRNLQIQKYILQNKNQCQRKNKD